MPLTVALPGALWARLDARVDRDWRLLRGSPLGAAQNFKVRGAKFVLQAVDNTIVLCYYISVAEWLHRQPKGKATQMGSRRATTKRKCARSIK